MISRQLELGFESTPGLQPAGRKRSRWNRAHWWFDQMREAVNEARDWPPAPLAPNAPTPAGALRQDASAGSRGPETEPPATEPRRWRFSRTRRLAWE